LGDEDDDDRNGEEDDEFLEKRDVHGDCDISRKPPERSIIVQAEKTTGPVAVRAGQGPAPCHPFFKIAAA
jgi:hypothetical protein